MKYKEIMYILCLKTKHSHIHTRIKYFISYDATLDFGLNTSFAAPTRRDKQTRAGARTRVLRHTCKHTLFSAVLLLTKTRKYLLNFNKSRCKFQDSAHSLSQPFSN